MDISITNVHLDLGAGRRGTDMGPSAIHVAGLIPQLQKLGHQIKRVSSIGSKSYESLPTGAENARFLPYIHEVCKRLHDEVYTSLQSNSFPLILGGDHSQAIGTISGIAKHYRSLNQKVGVLWVDAHTDMNTPQSTVSGNIHGMPLATLLGHGPAQLVELNGQEGGCIDPEKVVLIGIRSVDLDEVPLVKELGVRVYTMTEIDRRGAAVCFEEAIERAADGTAGIHLSFDLDGVDPKEAPGVGTPVPGGLNLRESHLLCELIWMTKKLIGMEVVELNPTLDIENRTGKLAVWLIQSVMGKRIM